MERADAIILGGGLVGLTLAVALDRHGFTSIVVDPAARDAVLAPGFDGRASAVASASGRMLRAIGVAERLDGLGQPIRAIRVSDGLAPGKIDFAPKPGGGVLGTMYENRALRRALHDTADAAGGVDLRMETRATRVERGETGVTATLDDGSVVAAPLLVAAEGRRSPTREASGIPLARWSYAHEAVIAAIGHDRPHGGVAYEIFYPAGPYAILPMLDDADGHRSALVWTVDARDAAGMRKLSDRAFLAEAERRMGGFLGTLRMAGPRSGYPLGFHHAARITDTRLALVGDAAHGIHPIAGQGLNLGFRDVAALTQVLAESARLGLDLGDKTVLDRYARWRSLDTLLVAGATDTLARLFGIPGRGASAVRRFGLGLVERVPPLKDRFMAEARGETGMLPALLTGDLA